MVDWQNRELGMDTDSDKLDQALEAAFIGMTGHYADARLAFTDVIPDGEQPDDVGSRQGYTCVYTPSIHAFFEVFVCVAGHCALQIGSSLFPISVGSAAIVLPGQWHHELSDGSQAYLGIWFVIDRDRCLFHLSGQDEGRGFFTLAGSALPADAYDRLMQQIRREIQNQEAHALEMIKICLVQLLIQARRDIAAGAAEHSHPDSWAEQVSADVIRYIENHCNRAIRLEDICHEVSMSGNYLNMLFKSVTGRTINQYAAEYKLRQARLLLRLPLSIQEIAARLGYYDPYHFSKSFKKATGLSPSQYRRSGKCTSETG